jgi:hypothetical protein
VLTGAASGCDPSVPPKGCSGCGRRHPSHPSMTSWLFTPRPEHQQHDACWTRGEPQCSGSMELSAGRLAQHSMHLVDSESCLPLSFDVPTTWPRSVPSKVAPRSDDEGRRGWPTGDDHSRAVYESVLRCCVFSAGGSFGHQTPCICSPGASLMGSLIQ